MLDHLETAHLGSGLGRAGRFGRSSEANSMQAPWDTSSTQVGQRQRTPIVAVAAISLMLLTAAAVVLPGGAPTGGLLFMYMAVGVHGVAEFARRHPDLLMGSPGRDPNSRGIEKGP